MKLKTKLIMPLLAIVPTVATITTVATSCGNSEKKDKVAGKIVIEKICPDEDKDLIIMTASKESFTNKEATEGFEVEFKVNIKVETYTYPLFLLEKISQSGKELGKDQYEIQYDKEKGMYGNTFKVKFNPGVKPGDLKFTIRLLESAADLPVLTNYVGNQAVEPDTVTATPAEISFLTWDQKLTIAANENEIQIKDLYLLTGATDSDLNEQKLESYDYTREPSLEKTATVKLTEWGITRLILESLQYEIEKIRIDWDIVE